MYISFQKWYIICCVLSSVSVLSLKEKVSPREVLKFWEKGILAVGSQEISQSHTIQQASHKRLPGKDTREWLPLIQKEAAGDWAGGRFIQGFLEEAFSRVEISTMGLVGFQGQGLVSFQGQGLGSFGGEFSNLEASVDFYLTLRTVQDS